LAVDISGVFHPAWIDNRSGVPNVWTAPVRVNGKARRHTISTDAPALEDVTGAVDLQVIDLSYDSGRDPAVAVVRARLRNASSRPLEGPFLARLISVRSALGPIEVVERANDTSVSGITWKFNVATRDRRLQPGGFTEEQTLTFRLSSPRANPWPSEPGIMSIVDLDVAIMGKRVAAETNTSRR
jgi:hypothetical protein